MYDYIIVISQSERLDVRATDVAEPLKPIEFPSRPWGHLGSDLFYFHGST